MSPAEPFRVDVAERVATVTLHRPHRLNALLWETYEALRDFFRRHAKDESVRAVVLTGAGRGFCSGGDVREVIGELVTAKPARILEFNRLACDVVLAVRKAPQPVIAAVNGVAVGGGAVLALACDLRLGSPEAKVAFAFPRVGLSGADMGACWLLPRVVGLGRATDWLLTGRVVDPPEALAAGFYSRVVPAESLLADAGETALRIAHGPRDAAAVTKRMLDGEHGMTLEQSLHADAALQSAFMDREDFREAYRAFLEKRDPRFTS